MEKDMKEEISITDDGSFISAKVDFAFKEMMKNKKALSSFLSAVLKIDIDSIADIEYVDTNLNKRYEEDKLSIMDVCLVLKNESKIGIEMQLAYYKYWINRVMYYNCRMLTDQEGENKKYRNFKKCVSISILDFNLYNKKMYPDFYSSYHLMEDKDHRIFSDKLEFHIIELLKLPKEMENADNLYLWSKFINSDSKEEMEMIAKNNIGIKEAYDELEQINNDAEKRHMYLRRQMAIMDLETQRESYYEDGREDGIKEGFEKGNEEGIKKGIEKGIEVGKLEFVKKLIDIMPIDQIAKLADLPIETVKNLAQQ